MTTLYIKHHPARLMGGVMFYSERNSNQNDLSDVSDCAMRATVLYNCRGCAILNLQTSRRSIC